MTDGFKLLTGEFDRVVNCPYPTQLKGLRDIVCTECTPTDIRKCLREKCCQLERLAGILLDGLSQWPYVLDIVTRFAVHVIFRDALFLLRPSVLSDILAQGAKTENVHSPYNTAAVAMLSHPLPDGYMLPAHVQTLFLRLVEHATRRPLAATVKPVLEVLRGTSTLLLGLLSTDSLTRFEEQLLGILRSSTMRLENEPEDKDNRLTLYCLAIMKVVSEARDDQLRFTNSSFDTQDLLVSTQAMAPKWNADAMRRFFTKPKTLQLLVLRVMDAIRVHHDRSLESVQEILVLALNLIAAIPSDLKTSWCVTNAVLMQRLQHKALAAGLDTKLKVQALAFLSQLSEVDCLSSTILDVGRQMSTDPKTLLQGFESDDTDAVISFVVGAVEPSTVSELLQNLLDYLSQAGTTELIDGSAMFAGILRRLSSAAMYDEQLAEAVAVALITQSFASKLHFLKEICKPNVDISTNAGAEPSVCDVVASNARNRILFELCGFLLQCASTAINTPQPIPGNTISILLEMHASYAQPWQSCSHSKIERHSASEICFVEEPRTPSEQPEKWKDALSTHLDAKSRAEHNKLTSIFTRACADLEARCHTAEEPLRKEQDSRVALQSEYDQLCTAYAELEMQGLDKDIRLDALKVEISQNSDDLDTARTEAAGLNVHLKNLERTVEDARLDADQRLARARSTLEMTTLEHATVLAGKQEELEIVQERDRLSHQNLESKEADIMELKTNIHHLHDMNDGLKDERDQLIEQNIEGRSRITQMEADAQLANTRGSQLEVRLSLIQDQMAKQEEAHQQHVQQLKDHANRSREDANASYNDSLERLAIQHGEEVAGLERQLSDLRSEIQLAAEHHATELAKRDDQLAEMEQQSERAQRRCKQKDRQIAEANTMRNNLMSAMGISNTAAANQAQVQADLPHRSRSSSTRSVTQHVPSSAQDPSPPTPSSTAEEEHHGRGEVSFASSTSSQDHSGPTPKRARPRKSFRPVAKTRGLLSVGKTARQSTYDRQPLLSLSVNRSPRKSVGRSIKDPGGAVNKDFSNDSTFAGSEIFTGTAAQAEYR